MKKLQYLKKHLRTQKESSELCENVLMFWEKDRKTNCQKLIDITLSNWDKISEKESLMIFLLNNFCKR